jgi:predicted nucleic acid-binding protein
MIVTDSSPLHYLLLIGAVEALPALFGRIAITDAVIGELTHRAAPDEVRAWMLARPGWLVLHQSPPLRPQLDLGAGESESIALALGQPERSILLDDRKAARMARLAGLTVTGTLGVLLLAAENGILDPGPAIDRLGSTSFRTTAQLLDVARERGEDLWRNAKH